MILLDANLLIYAYNVSSSHHERCRQWLAEAIAVEPAVRLPWTSILAFLRIATDPRNFGSASTPSEACAIIAYLLEQPSVEILSPGPRHWQILSKLIQEVGVRGPLIMDAHLAALAIEYGATLCTNDRDFARFPGLRVEFPLRPSL